MGWGPLAAGVNPPVTASRRMGVSVPQQDLSSANSLREQKPILP